MQAIAAFQVMLIHFRLIALTDMHYMKTSKQRYSTALQDITNIESSYSFQTLPIERLPLSRKFIQSAILQQIQNAIQQS